MQAQFAMASMCNSITGGKADTIVAYGDAKFACSGKGNEATPTTSVRRRLGTQCRVYDVDEFRTSKLCCACHSEMAGMPLPQSGDNTKAPLCLYVAQTMCTHYACKCVWHASQTVCCCVMYGLLDLHFPRQHAAMYLEFWAVCCGMLSTCTQPWFRKGTSACVLRP